MTSIISPRRAATVLAVLGIAATGAVLPTGGSAAAATCDRAYRGGPGSDYFYGTNQANTMCGRAGSDELWGFGGGDHLYGGGADDRLYGGGGIDDLYGSGGADVLHGNGRSDSLYGGDGDDELYGDGGPDYIVPGPGNDYWVIGGGGDDVIDAEDGSYDYIDCGAGSDTLWADPIDDGYNC